MTYEASLRYLDSFINYEKSLFSFTNRRWNLTRMRYLLQWAGHPEKKMFPVIIAGTKGKGSTGFFLEQGLLGAGRKVGFYSSPHLEDVRERIRVNGKFAVKSLWCSEIEAIQKILKQNRLPPANGQFTYFEILTLLAVKVFCKSSVDVGIFEIGMGGRYDAANAIPAALCILTPIHYDHEAFLGSTIDKIASEKAAVIHQHSHVVLARQFYPAAKKRIMERAKDQQAQVHKALSMKNKEIKLAGRFQKMNAGAALKASMILKNRFGFDLDMKKAESAICQAQAWPGRLEKIRCAKTGHMFLLDAAHNPASAGELAYYIRKLKAKKPMLVFGVSRDKKLDKILSLLSKAFSEVILTPFPGTRSREVNDMVRSAGSYFKRIYPCGSLQQAYSTARKLASSSALTVVTGSFYLVGQFRKWIRENKI